MSIPSDSPDLDAENSHGVLSQDGPSIAVLAQISESIRGIRYGQVTVIVQDGVVVQIDRLEKQRLIRGGERQPA